MTNGTNKAYRITYKDEGEHSEVFYAQTADQAKAQAVAGLRDCSFETWGDAIRFIKSCRRDRYMDPQRVQSTIELTEHERHVLSHSIGEWDGRPGQNGSNLPYRNYYFAPDGDTECEALLERGLLERHPRSRPGYFHVSKAGFDALGLMAPPPHPDSGVLEGR